MGTARFNIAVGEKYGALALSGAGILPPFPPEVHLGNDEWLLNSPPLQLQEHWERWLGEIRAKALVQSNLWLVVKRPSSTPAERNQETQELMRQANVLGGALFLATPLAYQSGYVFAGANVAGTVEVHEFADQQPRFRYSQGTLDATLDATKIPMLQEIVAGFDQILPFGSPYERITRGISAFLRGLQRPYHDARLHQFVRSLEGVMKPEIGRSRAQFVDRGQTFARANPLAVQILDESFRVRSQVEHLHTWEDALAHIPAGKQREDRLLLNVRRIEMLSRYVYTRICTSQTHRDLFRDDVINVFWKRPHDRRTALWGARLDLGAVK